MELPRNASRKRETESNLRCKRKEDYNIRKLYERDQRFSEEFRLIRIQRDGGKEVLVKGAGTRNCA